MQRGEPGLVGRAVVGVAVDQRGDHIPAGHVCRVDAQWVGVERGAS